MTRRVDVVFDLLYVNNWCNTNVKLRDRYDLLCKIVQEKPGILQIQPHEEGTTTADVYNTLETIMMRKGEGICIKDPESQYMVGERGDSWLKVKPDYISELGERLDVVVIGE